MRKLVILSAAALFPAAALAAPVLTLSEGVSPAVYANGGGAGFGGTLGSGSISMDVVGSDLVVGFTPGGSLNDLVGLFLDTRSGGFVDADMNDTSDGGRRVLSNLTRDVDDAFPALMGKPDFGIIFANFGVVVFELNAGTDPGHLNFQIFNGTPGSVSIPLATLGGPAQVDFFAAYVSDSGYASNESLPRSEALQANGNPGFGDGQFGGTIGTPGYENFNRFVIPEPATLGLLAGAGLLALRRRA
jgi:hypothetical protein